MNFNLKKEWFEKIKRGEKTHEYRLFNDYWNARIPKLKKGDIITFCKGYPKSDDNDSRLTAIIEKIDIDIGLKTDLKVLEYVWDIEFRLLRGRVK